MSFPSDVKLSTDAKYLGFIDSKKAYNVNWDIIWSFTYALSGIQHAFSTFLTTLPTQSSGIPGHYLNHPLPADHFLSVSFDSTGFSALTTLGGRSGIPLSSAIPNSLVIRDNSSNIVYNQALSSLSTKFKLSSSLDYYQTLRFRLGNGCKKLVIDFRTSGNYINLITLPLSTYTPDPSSIAYPGFSYTSPISSSIITPSTFKLRNFLSQGNTIPPTIETMTFIPLTSTMLTTYTTISGISATPR